MAQQPDDSSHGRSAAKRTAALLALVAAGFYFTFILMGVFGQ